MVARVSDNQVINGKMDVISDAATSEFPDCCFIGLVIDGNGDAHYVANIERNDAIDVLTAFVEELRAANNGSLN